MAYEEGTGGDDLDKIDHRHIFFGIEQNAVPTDLAF